jgi:hypothetical protein
VQWWLRTVFERWAHPVPYQGHSAELRSAWARVSGLRTHYRASGRGEQVVLVHGVGVSARRARPSETRCEHVFRSPDAGANRIRRRPPDRPPLKLRHPGHPVGMVERELVGHASATVMALPGLLLAGIFVLPLWLARVVRRRLSGRRGGSRARGA